MDSNEPFSSSTSSYGNSVKTSIPSVETGLERRVLLGFGLVFVVLVLIVTQAVRNTLLTRETSLWVNNTHAVLIETSGVLAALNAMEAAEASIILGAKQASITEWQRAYSDSAEHLQVAKALTVDNASQSQRLSKIEALVEKRRDYSRRIIELNKINKVESVRLLSAGLNEYSNQEVGRALKQLSEEENVLLQKRDQASVENSAATRWILYGGTGFNAVLLVAGFLLIRDDLRIRRAHALHLAQMNEVLEAKVRERTKELAVANEALEVENLERQWAYSSLEKHFRHAEKIVQSLSEAVLLVGSTGLIHQANPAAEKVLALRSQQGDTRKLAEILEGRDGAMDWGSHPVKLAMNSRTDLLAQTGFIQSSSGSHIAVSYSVHLVEDSGQVVMAIVGVTLPTKV